MISDFVINCFGKYAKWDECKSDMVIWNAGIKNSRNYSINAIWPDMINQGWSGFCYSYIK